jgi:hypothetical protein
MVIKQTNLRATAIIIFLVMGIVLFGVQQSVVAQEKPPRPMAIYVSTVQHLNFGDIILGPTGGTVTVHPDGTRTSTGDITLGNFGSSYSPALIEVEANRGTLITIINGPDITLTGSNGGSMTMKVGTSYPTSPFVTTHNYPTRTLVYIGGTLTVGTSAANPEGAYSGTFSVTFIQE